MELIGLVNSATIFLSQTTLHRQLTFLPRSQILSPALLDLFLSSNASIFLQWLSLHWEVLIMLLSHFPLNFHQIYNRMPYFIKILMIILTDWDSLCDHLGDAPWEDIFKLSAPAAAKEFCELVEVGIDLYVSHHMYQVKSHSSPRHSAAFAAAIVHRNHFFYL